jgi:uncharacterized SAM-binding protein YcdF (DUF218 family)
MDEALVVAGESALSVMGRSLPVVDANLRKVDAIVSLDGDRPRRLRQAVKLAVELTATGVAPTLVVVRAETAAPELLAEASLPFEILSVLPEPATTRGEARAIARLARQRGWQRILVVTSTYHVPRARMIFRRSVECDLAFVSAGCRRRRLPLDVCLESAKWILACTLRRAP